jgi:hypothetical protein
VAYRAMMLHLESGLPPDDIDLARGKSDQR